MRDARATPLDLDWAQAGYLRSPDGRHLRSIIGLDLIAHDAMTLGAQLLWAKLPGAHAGCCEGRTVYLAPWVWSAWPWWVRRLLLHELGHAAVGPSEHQVRLWLRHYTAMIEPPDCGC